MYVMRFDWHRLDDLFVKGSATGCPAHGRQQLVIKPLSPTQPATMTIKGYTRHQNQVQPVRWNGDTMCGRLADAELAMVEVPGEVRDLASDITPGGFIETGQGNGFSTGQSVPQQRPDVQFLGERSIKENQLRAFPDGLLFQ